MLCVAADSHDYQLVTWSKDQSLRLWRIDPQLQMVSSSQGILFSQKIEEEKIKVNATFFAFMNS